MVAAHDTEEVELAYDLVVQPLDLDLLSLKHDIREYLRSSVPHYYQTDVASVLISLLPLSETIQE